MVTARIAVGEGDATVLCESVCLLDLDVRKSALEGGEEVGGEGGGGSHDGAEGEGGGGVREERRGGVDHGEHDGRDEGGEVDMVAGKGGHEGAWVEAVHDDDLASAAEGGADDAGEAVYVEEGHEAEDGDAVHSHAHGCVAGDGEEGGREVGDHVAVAQHHPLRRPRRARRVRQRAQVPLRHH